MNEPAQTIRLFFALWPTEPVRQSILRSQQQAAQLHQGRCLRKGNLHLTLVFLGTIPNQYLSSLLAMAETIRGNVFNVTLDHAGLFSKPRCLWLGCAEKPAALMALAAQLARGVKACGLTIDERPYNPHVTIMRKVTALTDFQVAPIFWPVNEFCLVKSEPVSDGVEYSVVQRWPLQSG